MSTSALSDPNPHFFVAQPSCLCRGELQFALSVGYMFWDVSGKEFTQGRSCPATSDSAYEKRLLLE